MHPLGGLYGYCSGTGVVVVVVSTQTLHVAGQTRRTGSCNSHCVAKPLHCESSGTPLHCIISSCSVVSCAVLTRVPVVVDTVRVDVCEVCVVVEIVVFEVDNDALSVITALGDTEQWSGQYAGHA